MIVAVDGPAASGKGTLSRQIAAHFGLRYLDTGLTYRGVAHAMHQSGHGFDDVDAAVAAANALDFTMLGNMDLRSDEVGEGASRIAVMPALRKVLVERQRLFAQGAGKGAVLDGRDIGTVVCPDARVKLFVIASVEERARRRTHQLFGLVEGPQYDVLLKSLKARDERDMGRADSPLRPAADAHTLDTTRLTIEEALERAIALVNGAYLE
ncbi:(d)CMP kinase [Acuticoccus sp. MNP-M23]|uniref:(d)CMP kinase n=1 Tax=Acuticoccus sp. MNP-M23 TaxID=3072793 RepID=UPI002815504E|nr:(d)CMP kinase [Acuticoccus sp. MNP-M23]WMS43736.1 (d)CMP kinase [Acuticoccus sp. MNP-M23]